MARSLKPREKQRPIATAESLDGPAPAGDAPAIAGRRRDVLICAVLLLATFAVYAQTGRHELILFDDPDYVTVNEHVRAGLTWDGVVWAFTNNQAGNWFPLTWLSHMLDCQIFGVDSGAIHLMNVLYHSLSALLLFLVLKRMTGGVWRSALVAFLFSLHPLHVESVAWVAERKDVLSGLLCFLTIWVYLSYVKRPGWLRYAIVVGVFSLALMAKSMVVTLPLLLLLLDFWPLRRIGFGNPETRTTDGKLTLGRAFLEKIPLLALSAGVGAFTYISQQGSHYVLPLSMASLPQRLSNALVSTVVYIGNMFWPVRLAVFYPFVLGRPWWQPAASGLAILGVSILAFRSLRRHPYLAVGWCWYLVALAPVIGLIQVGSQARADRYTYIPMIGIWIALVWGAAALTKKRPALLKPMTAAAVVLCVACAGLSWRQVGYWRDTITLFRYSLSVTTGNSYGYNILGLALWDKGRLDEAIASYREAIRLRPDFEDAHANLSQALLAKGLDQEALFEIAVAARINPQDAGAQYDLGTALANDGRFEDAVIALSAAVKLNPNYAKAHANLGGALASLGRLDEAIAEFTEALRIDPGLEGVHDNLEAALAMREQTSGQKH